MAVASRVCCPDGEDERFWAENVRVIDDKPTELTTEAIQQWWAEWWADLNSDGWLLPALAVSLEVAVKRWSSEE